MQTCGIYKITNMINGKSYIGQSVNCEKRIKCHTRELNKSKHFNNYLQRDYNKYGKDTFKFEPFIACKPEELNDWEIFLIKSLDLMNTEYGYNMSKGGELSTKGTKLSPEHCKKISEAHKGKKLTKEHKIKISRLGNKVSERGCKNISIGLLGNKYRIGKTHSVETKKKISESVKKSKGSIL